MGVVWHVMGMLNSQVLGVFCTVEAEVLLFSNPTETVCGLYSGELFTPGSYVQHALYMMSHSSYCYKKVFDLVNASLGDL